MSNKAVRGVVNVQRRTWNREEYERKALEREAASATTSTSTTLAKFGIVKNKDNNNNDNDNSNQSNIPTEIVSDTASFVVAAENALKPSGTSLAFASAHPISIDFSKLVGKTFSSNPNEPNKPAAEDNDDDTGDSAAAANKTGGNVITQGNKIKISVSNPFYCPICDFHARDSAAFLTHRNSRTHLARLGFSTSVKKTSSEEAKSRLRMHIESKGMTSSEHDAGQHHHQENSKNDDESESVSKKREREDSNEANGENDATDIPENDDMMKLLGFSSFSGNDQAPPKAKKKN